MNAVREEKSLKREEQYRVHSHLYIYKKGQVRYRSGFTVFCNLKKELKN